MTNDEVFDQRLEFAGEVRNLRDFGVHHFQLDHHVSEQLAAGGVRERTVVREFVNFSDVVQERSRKQQITIDLRIIAANQIAGAEK